MVIKKSGNATAGASGKGFAIKGSCTHFTHSNEIQNDLGFGQI